MTLPEHPAAHIETLERSLAQARQELRDFRTEVRRRIIQAHKDGDICRDGMNDGLRDLGLDEYVPKWTGTVTLTVGVTVTGTTSETVARQWAQDALGIESHDSDVDVATILRDTHGFADDGEEDE